jgi:hypothetical protein
MPRPRFTAGLALAGTLLALALPAAHAATVQRSVIQSAVMACQASTPAFDASLRKKPIGVDNVGTGTAYVTCGLGGDAGGTPTSTWVGVVLRNPVPFAASVTCTLVDAGSDLNSPKYLTKSVFMPPFYAGEDLYFDSAADNGNVAFTAPAISCALPAGAGVAATSRQYPEDIGS